MCRLSIREIIDIITTLKYSGYEKLYITVINKTVNFCPCYNLILHKMEMMLDKEEEESSSMETLTVSRGFRTRIKA